MVALGAVGLALGSVAMREGFLPREGLRAGAAGVVLAAAASLGGFALLRRGIDLPSRAFSMLLVGIFLGRVALVVAFGVALYLLDRERLAVGLLSLVGFHFVYAMIEVSLLIRSGFRGLRPGDPA